MVRAGRPLSLVWPCRPGRLFQLRDPQHAYDEPRGWAADFGRRGHGIGPRVASARRCFVIPGVGRNGTPCGDLAFDGFPPGSDAQYPHPWL